MTTQDVLASVELMTDLAIVQFGEPDMVVTIPLGMIDWAWTSYYGAPELRPIEIRSDGGVAAGDAGRVGVVHNGVDHMAGMASSPAVLDRLKLTPGGYCVMFGSVKQYKNVEVVMRAFGLPGLGDATLVVVGATGDAHARAGIGAPANVMFAGSVSDPELKGLYQNALCVLMPSRTEGFGLPPVEAMQLGCPAVVAPAGALPEVCVDAACYAGTDDPAEWVAAITALRDDPGFRQAKVDAGRRRAAQLSWARAGRALLDHALVMAGAPAIAGAALDTEARLEPEPGRTVELV